MVAERIGRYSLTLSEDDARALEAYAEASDLPHARWAANVIRRELRRLQAGGADESLSQQDLDVLNGARELLRAAPVTFADWIDVLVAVRDRPSARPKLAALAESLRAETRTGSPRRKR